MPNLENVETIPESVLLPENVDELVVVVPEVEGDTVPIVADSEVAEAA